MPKIEKFTLEIASAQIIPLPEKYEILSCQVKAKKPTLWIKVHDSEIYDRLTIKIFATGTEIDADSRLEFLATCQIGALTLHVFKLNTK